MRTRIGKYKDSDFWPDDVLTHDDRHFLRAWMTMHALGEAWGNLLGPNLDETTLKKEDMKKISEFASWLSGLEADMYDDLCEWRRTKTKK